MPRESLYGARFNHDEDAPGYDADVQDESHPIRAGYSAALGWVAGAAAAAPAGPALELGCGTGNLSLLLPQAALCCVDLSAAMIDLARPKLAGRSAEFVQADLLAALGLRPGPWQAIVSTYAIHHLTDDEKDLLFTDVAAALAPGGVFACGDLMFEDPAARAAMEAGWVAAGKGWLVEALRDEFFWDLSRARSTLVGLGLAVETRRFSRLSWGIRARRASA